MRRKLLLAPAIGLTIIGSVCVTQPVASADTPPAYEPTVESLNSHPVPQWFNDDKFGIFIHWGAYSVPAWGPRGSYAEWYWNYMNSRGSATNAYHKATYGQDVNYDAFLRQWKAEKFDAADWVKLFKDAGAKYFVLTSKHHEGMALWDSKVSGRDSVDLGPGRDLAKELFDAARKDDAKLKAGFYYSLYEWYNPAYTGRPATNPYTGAEVPYTGAPSGGDYVKDYMLPQMRELIDGYDPDIIWCDGQWEKPASYWNTAGVLADYYNKALKSGKEVAVANRCKIQSGNLDSPELDFQTPEYTVKPDIDPVKWESSRGIAHSYGYNQNEPEEDHLTSDQLVDSLVDIVSKNGNLLLDIGPKADGTIPEIQRQRLLDIGAWLRDNGEAIYGTTYWNRAEEKGGPDDVRYTVKDGTLYATALNWPGEQLTLGADLPVDHSTRITMLGSAARLSWSRDEQGRVVVNTPQQTGKHAYVFKIETPGVHSLLRTSSSLAKEIAPAQTISGELTVANPGKRHTPATTLSLTAPQGWSATLGAPRMRPLGPGESVKVPISVSAPVGAVPGEYTVDLRQRTGRMETTTALHLTVNRPNLSLGKPAVQKSTGYDAPASRAVDGNTDGNWGAGTTTHTAEPETQAWWQVDLGASAALDSVDVWNRLDCCADRLKDFWVMASDQPFTSDDLDQARTAPGVTAVHVSAQAGSPSKIKLPDGTRGRHVRIQLASPSNPLSLAEIQVRGQDLAPQVGRS
ncbi:alpha-L-fucosidase [Nonomuraea sp. NPDC049152]|uniref:alpha-L-fucosidase n=1 Tax=Nonomuraea sp. NPDC049152 TaxID=3154350 RepID=UPI0034119ACE